MADPKDVHQDAVNVQKEVAQRAKEAEEARKAALRRKLSEAQLKNVDEIRKRGGDVHYKPPSPKKKKGS